MKQEAPSSAPKETGRGSSHRRSYKYKILHISKGEIILATDQEILARIKGIENRLEKMEATLESINKTLKRVEDITNFGCTVE